MRKAPEFGPQANQPGVVQTQQPVQFGCFDCAMEGLAAPSENHVAYMWSGTSFCFPHLMQRTQPQQVQGVTLPGVPA